jgi:hypothetical protein
MALLVLVERPPRRPHAADDGRMAPNAQQRLEGRQTGIPLTKRGTKAKRQRSRSLQGVVVRGSEGRPDNPLLLRDHVKSSQDFTSAAPPFIKGEFSSNLERPRTWDVHRSHPCSCRAPWSMKKSVLSEVRGSEEGSGEEVMVSP